MQKWVDPRPQERGSHLRFPVRDVSQCRKGWRETLITADRTTETKEEAEKRPARKPGSHPRHEVLRTCAGGQEDGAEGKNRTLVSKTVRTHETVRHERCR